MTANKRAYYENPTARLKVVPEETRSVGILTYRIDLENEKIAQWWFAIDRVKQFNNPYLAMGNNPVVYVDPDGEFVFFMPHISFGNGSFDIGLTVGLGFYKAASVQATIGHTFQEGDDNTYGSVGASLAGFTASVEYGTQTGMTAGVGFGFGPPGVNSNMFSAGVSWSQNYGTSVHAFGASYGNGGFGFSPNMGFSYQTVLSREPVYENPLSASVGGPDDPPNLHGGWLNPVYIYPPTIIGHITKAMYGPGAYNPSSVSVSSRPRQSRSGKNHYYPSTSSNASVGIAAFRTSQGVKNALLNNATKSSPALANSTYLKGAKVLGRGSGALMGLTTGYEIYSQKQFNASHALDLAITAATFVPGFGWAIGGGYFFANIITKRMTGMDIGQHLDSSIGGSLYEF